MTWGKLLLNWYSDHAREFPWRNTTDPYRIWLSEIILQQTRTQQGLPYYQKFVERFPTVEHLADADEEEVLKLWQGLGYYSRARNLHFTAQTIRDRYDGKFPQNFEELLQLKGVGDYTASAIGSICFGLRQAVVDGNVYRVLSRYFGDSFPIDHHKALAHFKKIAQKLMEDLDPAGFNQAMMEFGALHCTPKKPLCQSCPFQHNCVAYQTQQIHLFPRKEKKTKIRKRYFHYLVIDNTSTKTYLQARQKKDIWQGLYEFPLLEKNTASLPSVSEWGSVLSPLGLPLHQLSKKPVRVVQHLLSHQKLLIHFWILSLDKEAIPVEELSTPKDCPLPVPLLNFVEEYFYTAQ
ncbi:MAG: A/G-specific adenine glycosylase [Flavobacteriaceae bacterium]